MWQRSHSLSVMPSLLAEPVIKGGRAAWPGAQTPSRRSLLLALGSIRIGEGGLLEGLAVARDARVAGLLQHVHQLPGQLLPVVRVGRLGGDVLHLIAVLAQVVQLLRGAAGEGQ